MTEYCPYIKYRRRPAVVPRSPSGRLGCGGRPPPTFAPSPARCRGVAATRRSSLGVLSRRPRRKRRGRSPARSPGRGCSPLAGFCGTRRARGRRVPRSVPRALFGFPAPLRRLVKACLASAAGGRLCRPARRRFAVSSAGGRRAALPPLLAVLAVPSPGKPLRPSGRRLRRRACPPLRRSLRSSRPFGSLWVGSSRRCRALASALGFASVARAPRGEPPFSRGSPLASLARAARPCPLRRAAAAASLPARLPTRRRGRRRLCGVFGGRVFRGLRPRGRGLRFAPPMAARVSVGGSVRPPTFHRGRAPPIFRRH